MMPFVVNGGIYCLATEASLARALSWEMQVQIFVVCRSTILPQFPIPCAIASGNTMA